MVDTTVVDTLSEFNDQDQGDANGKGDAFGKGDATYNLVRMLGRALGVPEDVRSEGVHLDYMERSMLFFRGDYVHGGTSRPGMRGHVYRDSTLAPRKKGYTSPC